MFWKYIHSNIIKWWQIIYNPIVRKIFPTKQEQIAYDEAESQKKEKPIDPDLLHNKNYNATTGAMSGEYGTRAMDEATKQQLDNIMTNNNTTSNLVESLLKDQVNEADSAAKEEEIRKANEIYERLLKEAKEDEEKRQQEILDAMKESQT